MSAFDGENAEGTWTLSICNSGNAQGNPTDRDFTFNSAHLFFDGTATPAITPGEISGTVFRDYDADGTNDSGESGIENIAIMLYDTNGNSASTITAADGSYTIATGSGIPGALDGTVRIEFTLPADGGLDFFHPGAAGGTTVQFADIDAGATVDVGFNNPADYCQSDPPVVTSCYVVGDNTNALDVLISFPYSASGQSPNAAIQHEALANQIGTTFGLAYQSSSDTLFAAAYQKRHSGYGSTDSTGAIYMIPNPSDGATSPAPSLFLNLNSPSYFGASAVGVNPHPRGSTDFTVDAASWDAAGKVAFGDLDIAEDGRSLWTINLHDRQLYEIPLGSDARLPLPIGMFLLMATRWDGLPPCSRVLVLTTPAT